jgi:tRNA-dihydrouridine synthase A
MVTTGALVYGDVERHLRFDEIEHPVALQLGGSEPRPGEKREAGAGVGL